MLSAVRVLDLTDERGQLCGQILAALGAEVILVEPPGGSSARRVGPFAGAGVDPALEPERSLRFWAHNRGKQSVVLDWTDPAGAAQLRELAAGADVLVECEAPGRLAELGLGPEELAARNPALVHVSITPFGGGGPKAQWPASDLTILAASGSLVLNGDEDRPPVRPGPEGQAGFHAAAEAAGAALIALHERARSGLGQHVDVSAAQAANQACISQMLAAALHGAGNTRSGRGVKLGALDVQLTFPCKDGFIVCIFLFGASFGPFTRRLMDWAHEEGFVDAATRDKDWLNYTMMLLDGREPVAEYEREKRELTAFFQTKTKAELMDEALARKLLIVPIVTVRDVRESPQFAHRQVWEEVDHGELGRVRYPGPMAKFSATPRPPLPAAPRLGAHTAAVLGAPPRRPSAPAPAPAGAPPTGAPLAGLKVVDLMWVMAGPAASRVMADHGATVVRVESSLRLDTARTLQPFRNDDADVEYSGLYHNNNAGKLGLALRLDRPEGREVLLDLVRWADVVLEAYSPGVLAGWGLGYEQFRAVNPGLIMASTCLLGQTGPHARLAGYGTMAAAVAGFHYLCGWPDRGPAGPFGAYTDTVAPRFLLAGVLAALEHRRLTGVGQYLDLSQAEASMPFLASALLDYEVNGRVAERAGNEDSRFFPHGVHPAAGVDEWVAVVCETDAQWRALCAAVGLEGLAGLGAAVRRARREEIDAAISAWTSARDAEQAAAELAACGVPAHKANRSADFLTDPQLLHRGHVVRVAHATQPEGVTYVEGPRFTLSRTPASVTRGGPTLGEHAFEILNGLLGYSEDRIAELAAAELLE
ncbi:MAG: CaiB/BaiF CoA transferase family protein [Acidimicrobiales bacterium]